MIDPFLTILCVDDDVPRDMAERFQIGARARAVRPKGTGATRW
ncbi:MAG: hypothetical protein ACLT98_15915 [Eggerthellaceae bacterium]